MYLLLAAMGIALVACRQKSDVIWPIDVTVIAVVILLNAVLGWAEQNKARQAVAAFTPRKAGLQDCSYIFCGAQRRGAKGGQRVAGVQRHAGAD